MTDEVARQQVRAALAGEQDAYTALYRMLCPIVGRVSWRFFRGSAMGEDFEADALAHILTRLEKYQGTAKFSTWSTSVAYNLACMALRSRKKERECTISLDEPLGEDSTYTVGDRIAVAGDGFARLDAQIDLDRVMAELAPGYRQTLEMFYLDGMSHEEIASATGLVVGASKSSRHRAIRRARRLMEGLEAIQETPAPATAGMTFAPKVCICGCGQEFTPNGPRQVFVFGHRMPVKPTGTPKLKADGTPRKGYERKTRPELPAPVQPKPQTAPAVQMTPTMEQPERRMVELRIPATSLDNLLKLLPEHMKISALEAMLADA